MAFCPHCGKEMAAGSRFCQACGVPLAPDAINAITAESRRLRALQMVAIGMCAAMLAIGALLWTSLKRGPASSTVLPSTSAPSPQPQPALPASQPVTGPAVHASQPTPSPAASLAPGINMQAVQDAVTKLAPHNSSGSAAQSSALPTPPGSDRYPGSTPVNVENANVPDIGIPVKSEVYSTSDSVATVIAYYQQRYPDAQVMEVNGQKVIAVDRPGNSKVIAVASGGSDTRIAIVQPAN